MGPGPDALPVRRGSTWRLGLLFGLQFAIPGAWLPILYPYLTGARGLAPGEVGTVFAVAAVGSFLAPLYAGQLADRVLHGERLLGVLHLAVAALLLALAGAETYPAALWTCFAIGLVHGPTVGLSQAICLTHLNDRQRLGPLRLWGTVGWLASGIVVGQWLLRRHTPAGVGEEAVRAAQDAGRVDAVLLAAGLALLMGVYCLVALPPTPPTPDRSFAPGQALRRFGREPLRTLIVAAGLLACVDRFYLVHGAEFLSRWGRDEPGWLDRLLGVGGTGLMSLGQMTEVVVLACFPFLAARLPARRMFLIAAGTFTVRMALFAWVEALPVVLLGVALHGLCYTFLFFAGFLVVDELCPPSIRTSAQTLFQLAFGGIGGLFGSLIAGRAAGWAEVDGTLAPGRLFLVPLGMAAVATALLWWRYPRHRPERNDGG